MLPGVNAQVVLPFSKARKNTKKCFVWILYDAFFQIVSKMSNKFKWVCFMFGLALALEQEHSNAQGECVKFNFGD